MLETMQFFATLSTALFCGAAIYVNVAEQPSRRSLDSQSAVAQWAASYKRATWMQAPLAIVGFIAGGGVWLLGGGVLWLIAGPIDWNSGTIHIHRHHAYQSAASKARSQLIGNT